MPAGDNPHSISEKKAALRESPKQSKNATVNQQARAPPFPKDKAAETVGIKRPQPNGPLSPTNHHVPGNPGANGHLVYVRRKVETDQSKGGATSGAEGATSLSSKKPGICGPQEQSLKRQNSVPNAQSAPVSASPAASASIPALHSASLPANLSFAKQSPGKVSAQPSVAVTASPPQRNVVSTAMPQNFAAVNAASPPQRNVVSTAMLQNFTASNTASLPQRNVVSTAMPQNFTAANTASPPRRNVVSTAMPQNFTAANTPSPPQRSVLSTAMPQNFTAASTASPPQRNVVSTAMPQNFTAANTATPTHGNVVSAAVPQNFTTVTMAHCNVAATSTASRDAVATTTTRSPASLQRSSNQDWKERFLRLQEFLKSNEQSGQEEYIRMLHSLSSVGRSKHAIELEKRAVNLLIEEGKELQKMKSLNVLGKLPPTDHPSVPTQPTFAMRLPFQPFPARR
ncbi:nascent polypeptide-associated complex subunit alpha, muscle-specific form-like [Lolium rigidum]|uniref:nascent polypeptide-associated complex subunit alpha, muscle-specific form-like n=1 Tax=Lolium rigidum TaxID=89674 RepID=UPI001F5DF0B2|nr:nascent polypeptide-associated complex subunit alpha, muscle-specific form-like [Lolium rigidum]